MSILPYFFCADGPGAALAVVVDDQAPHIECCGLADIPNKVRITADTIFDLASASKTFTAVGVLLLVERDFLDLSAAVATYLPQMVEPEVGRPISIRDLLSHTSDLPDYLESGMYTPVDQVSPRYVLDQLPAWSRAARPGRRFSYCNTNYFVLAKIVEVVSGMGFAEFVLSELADPLGLHQTNVGGAENERPEAEVAVGYRDFGYGLPSIERSEDYEVATLGDGGVSSSLNDLIRWQTLLWSGEVVEPSTLELMSTPGRLQSGESFEYGLGLQVERRPNGQTWCGHGGSWTNSTIMVGRYLEARTSVIVLSNEVMAPVERISQRARAILSKL